MAEELFKVDQTELKRLRKIYKGMPRLFAAASGDMLNNFAFGTRNTSMEVIRTRMTVRNPRFMERHLKVQKTHTKLPISSQEAEIGSTTGKRFSGWREQQTGEKPARSRVFNLLARRGSEKRQAAPRARLKPGNVFKRFSEFKGASPNMRSTRMLQALSRTRWKKPFFLTKKRGVQPGLWVFKGRKLKPLQLFKKRKKVQRINWMEDARNRYFSREDIQALWAKTIRAKLKRMSLR